MQQFQIRNEVLSKCILFCISWSTVVYFDTCTGVISCNFLKGIVLFSFETKIQCKQKPISLYCVPVFSSQNSFSTGYCFSLFFFTDKWLFPKILHIFHSKWQLLTSYQEWCFTCICIQVCYPFYATFLSMAKTATLKLHLSSNIYNKTINHVCDKIMSYIPTCWFRSTQYQQTHRNQTNPILSSTKQPHQQVRQLWHVEQIRKHFL